MAVDTEAVLHEVNAQLGTRWALVDRLKGGYQSGAFLITDPAGRRAVLKWTASTEWAPVVLMAEPVIAAARRGGWPTPAWLAVGTIDDGSPYEIQEYVDGAPQDPVTQEWLDLVLPVIASQAGLGASGMRNWSVHDHETVYRDKDGHQALLARTSAAGASLVETIAAVTRPFAETVLPAEDLVHGDLDPSNVLIHDGAVVALVDAEGIGRGTRLHDLADLALHTALWDTRDVHERVVRECRALAESGWFEITLNSIALGLMAFGVHKWSRTDLDHACDATRLTLLRLFGS